MSRIDELIQQLCPDGVEYKPLGEIGTFIRGNGLQKKDFVDHGVGCIHYGQIYTYYKTFATETKSFVSEEKALKLKKAHPGDLIIATTSENTEDVCKAVAWLGKEDICISGDAYVYHHSQNPKYLAYIFQTQSFYDHKKKFATGTKVIRLSDSAMGKFQCPVPPLPVQEEIVRILDKFTALEAELEAELEARRKQYEFYRDQLLTFGDEVEWKPLGEVCDLKAGKSISANQISKKCENSFRFPCWGGNGMRGYVKECSHKGQYPIIGRQGALCGNISFALGAFYATEHAIVVSCHLEFIPRFLFHLLVKMELNQYATGGAQPGLSVEPISKRLAFSCK